SESQKQVAIRNYPDDTSVFYDGKAAAVSGPHNLRGRGGIHPRTAGANIFGHYFFNSHGLLLILPTCTWSMMFLRWLQRRRGLSARPLTACGTGGRRVFFNRTAGRSMTVHQPSISERQRRLSLSSTRLTEVAAAVIWIFKSVRAQRELSIDYRQPTPNARRNPLKKSTERSRVSPPTSQLKPQRVCLLERRLPAPAEGSDSPTAPAKRRAPMCS